MDAERLKDRELAKGIAKGDPGSLRCFFVEYQAPIYRYLLCLTGGREDAEDLTQDTLVRARTAISGFRGEASLKTWVYRVAYHSFTHWFRRRRPVAALTDNLPANNHDFEAIEAGQAVLGALNQIGPALAHPFVLFEVNGLSIPEIAVALDIPEGTVKSRLHTARTRLREALSTLEPTYVEFK